MYVRERRWIFRLLVLDWRPQMVSQNSFDSSRHLPVRKWLRLEIQGGTFLFNHTWTSFKSWVILGVPQGFFLAKKNRARLSDYSELRKSFAKMSMVLKSRGRFPMALILCQTDHKKVTCDDQTFTGFCLPSQLDFGADCSRYCQNDRSGNVVQCNTLDAVCDCVRHREWRGVPGTTLRSWSMGNWKCGWWYSVLKDMEW